MSETLYGGERPAKGARPSVSDWGVRPKRAGLWTFSLLDTEDANVVSQGAMNYLVLFLITLEAFPFLFPDEFLYWSRNIRRWLEEKRNSAWLAAKRQWEQDKEAVETVDRDLKIIQRKMAAMKRVLDRVQKRKAGSHHVGAVQRQYEALMERYAAVRRHVADAKKEIGAKSRGFAP